MGCTMQKQKNKMQTLVLQIQETEIRSKESPQTPETVDMSGPRQQNIIVLKKLLASSRLSVDQIINPTLKKSSHSTLNRKRRSQLN
ncbi:unnamed protein product [Paramecium sonneborni]|uniref:Uncharacterized protein n=1 Tax=Paramecium sonneborni TaxID=65129 RepID=A0A8S1KI36_9CILI|nr:unnamed protein product [Paramecium sonneborni]